MVQHFHNELLEQKIQSGLNHVSNCILDMISYTYLFVWAKVERPNDYHIAIHVSLFCEFNVAPVSLKDHGF